MSVRVLTKAFEDRSVKLGARLVLLALADSAWDDGVTWDSQENLARKALVTEQTVRSAIRELETKGVIETRKAQRGKNRINVYRMTFDGLNDVDYDRLPFAVKEPFTTAEDLRSSETHDRKSTHDTTAESRRSRARGSSLARKSTRKCSGGKPPSLPAVVEREQPPAIKKIDGQNVPLNALLQECGIDPGNKRRVTMAATALNGRGNDQGIVHLFWLEAVRWCDEHHNDDALADLRADPHRYAEGLVKQIRRKAAMYRDAMGGAHLTPTALRNWWLDLELKQRRDGGTQMTRQDFETL